MDVSLTISYNLKGYKMSYNTIIFDNTDVPTIGTHYDPSDKEHTNGNGYYLMDLISYFDDYEAMFQVGEITKEEFDNIEKGLIFFSKNEEAHFTYSS